MAWVKSRYHIHAVSQKLLYCFPLSAQCLVVMPWWRVRLDIHVHLRTVPCISCNPRFALLSLFLRVLTQTTYTLQWAHHPYDLTHKPLPWCVDALEYFLFSSKKTFLKRVNAHSSTQHVKILSTPREKPYALSLGFQTYTLICQKMQGLQCVRFFFWCAEEKPYALSHGFQTYTLIFHHSHIHMLTPAGCTRQFFF